MISSSPLVAWQVEANVQGSLAILLVAVSTPLLRRWLGAQTTYWLWSLVLFRLLVPGLPPSPIHWPELSIPKTSTPWFATAYLVESAEKSVPIASIPATHPPTTRAVFPIQTFALSIWVTGVALILGFALVRSLRASRLARRARDISHDPELLARLRELSLLWSRFRIRETRELRSPALCGLLRPIILLPLDWRERLGPTELRCVLLHEIGHFQRGDLLWRWAFFFVCAIHWFNPLVWIAGRLARNHQEMACDEWVISRANLPSAILYGEALLAISTHTSAPRFAFPVQAEMAESKNRLRRRIAHLAGIRPHGWAAHTAALLVTCSLIVVTGPVRSASPKNFLSDSDKDISPPTATPVQTDFITDQTPRAKGTSPIKLQVQIESKFVQVTTEVATKFFGETGAENDSLGIRAIYSDDQFQDLMRKLDSRKGVDLMSMPTVTTKSGNKAVINVIREFHYPTQFDPPQKLAPPKDTNIAYPILTPTTPSAFETRNLGVTLEVTPTVGAGGHSIDLELAPEVVDFAGFINYGSPILVRSPDADDDRFVEVSPNVINQPVFSVRRMRTFLSVKDRQTVLVGVMNINDRSITESSAPAGSKLPRSPGSNQSVFVFITATLLDREGRPISGGAISSRPSPSSMQKPIPPGTTPYGTPVKGKPGFVTSPHAPFAGYVDVRGFQPNAEVKDPYTGKMFLVP